MMFSYADQKQSSQEYCKSPSLPPHPTLKNVWITCENETNHNRKQPWVAWTYLCLNLPKRAARESVQDIMDPEGPCFWANVGNLLIN